MLVNLIKRKMPQEPEAFLGYYRSYGLALGIQNRIDSYERIF